MKVRKAVGPLAYLLFQWRGPSAVSRAHQDSTGQGRGFLVWNGLCNIRTHFHLFLFLVFLFSVHLLSPPPAVLLRFWRSPCPQHTGLVLIPSALEDLLLPTGYTGRLPNPVHRQTQPIFIATRGTRSVSFRSTLYLRLSRCLASQGSSRSPQRQDSM